MWAFLCYACGLLAVFNGTLEPVALMVGAASAGVAATLLRRVVPVALLALFLSGAVIATVTPPSPSPWARAAGALEPVRTELGRQIDVTFTSNAEIARALLIADQRQLGSEVRDRYAAAGLVHMLSISGLHVAIIASSLELMLLALRLRRRAAAALSVVLVFFYVAVLDWPAPALRSAVMYGTVSLSRAVQRPASPWAALAIGGWIPLVSPRTVMELGYQLSLCGMAALTVAGELARRWKLDELGAVRSRIVRDLLTSTLASITTAPLVSWYFGRVSVVGPVANLFAGPVISLLQPALFVALALSPFRSAATFVADAVHPLFAAFDWVARVAASLPHAAPDVAPTLAGSIAASVAVGALLLTAAGRRTGRWLILGAAAVAAAMLLPLVPRSHDEIELHVLDVGQGDAVALRTDRGNWVLFDAGRSWKRGDAGRSVVVPYVRRRGGDVLALVLSHPHADHVGGAGSAIRWLRPGVLWDPAYVGSSSPYRDALNAAMSRSTRWQRVNPGDTVAADGVHVRFLAPDSAWTAGLDDPNEASAVALVRYGRVTMLLTGDAEAAEESWLLRNAGADLDVDVLKVAHHGSRTSSGAAFLAAVTPRVALVSVGADNAYSHPSPEVIARLHERGARVLRTDRGGSIIVRTNGDRIQVRQGGSSWVSLQ